MNILYVSQLATHDSAWYRVLALRREGHQVITINTLDYGQRNPLLKKIEFRATTGPEVSRLNRDILASARRDRPDVLWADKLLWMRPETLDTLRSLGVVTVSYMIDNFFGPRRDPGWRLYAKTIPLYDLHCTQRDRNVLDYRKAGARDVIKVQTAYEPTVHYPSEPAYTDSQRDRGVSFIGTSYDDRAETLTRLHQQGFPVVISGGPQHWKRTLTPALYSTLFREGELYGKQYREAIWRSKINLSFLTHSNQDEFAHKSFEIAACGGFLLAERSDGHSERFREDEEAVFFSDFEECVRKIELYLPNQAERQRIAVNGQRRAATSGYDNDTQVRRIVQRVRVLVQQQAERVATSSTEAYSRAGSVSGENTA